ncbi:phosphate ABC transporter permease PstA [Leptolyngbya sp. 'hensonii']|uniref:phosphate ABC transporter permease PstA n=1 Tax=Leptolyngbya sp. 'hensonii' TaxID=1922337 RepID=UPI00209AB2DC|nr:phosphate ABC transporter permease PstA [Leptolyngbya sp. 'hensonii']
MTVLTFVAAGIALLPLIAVLSYVLIQGAGRLGPAVFTELPPPPLVKGGGFGNAFIGTLLTVGIASLFSVPFGIMAAVYLSEFARETKIASVIDFLTNVLSGVPSIVIGVFAYGIVVLTTGTYSVLAGGVALAVLMLPTIVRTAAEAMESVSNDIRQASVGLGATDFQTVSRVVLPAAAPSIVTGVMLAVARAAGETAPLIFTALFSQFWINWSQNGLLQPTATLSVLVFNFAIVPYKNQQQLAWSGSLVLVAFVLITSVISRLVVRRKSR